MQFTVYKARSYSVLMHPSLLDCLRKFAINVRTRGPDRITLGDSHLYSRKITKTGIYSIEISRLS